MSNCNTCPSQGSCGKKEASCGIVNNSSNKISKVIGVMSGKGGVGKSSITVLLAKQFAREGYKVGILDADITGPSIPRLLGLEHKKAYGTNDAIEPVIASDGIKSISLNYLLEDENQPVIWRGPMVGNAVKQFWTDVIWGELDYLFIDMPPGIGDVALTVLQSIPINGVVMISTPQPMVSMIVSKAINMCKQMDIKVLGAIENMSYVECDNCGNKIHIYDTNDTAHFLEENNMELLGELPMTSSIAKIHCDDDFDVDTIERVYAYIKPAVKRLIELLK